METCPIVMASLGSRRPCPQRSLDTARRESWETLPNPLSLKLQTFQNGYHSVYIRLLLLFFNWVKIMYNKNKILSHSLKICGRQLWTRTQAGDRREPLLFMLPPHPGHPSLSSSALLPIKGVSSIYLSGSQCFVGWFLVCLITFRTIRKLKEL